MRGIKAKGSRSKLIQIVGVGLAVFLNSCGWFGGDKPPEPQNMIQITEDCPTFYCCDSEDSLEVWCEYQTEEALAGSTLSAWFEGSLDGGDSVDILSEYKHVPGSTSPVEIMLCWKDTVESGIYKLWAKWSEAGDTLSPMAESDHREILIFEQGAGTNPHFPILWSGDNRVGRKGDFLVHPLAYRIFVMVIDTTLQGANGDWIDFVTTGGQLQYDHRQTRSQWDTCGLAENFLTLPQATGEYTVTATLRGTELQKQFSIRCIDDEEGSGLPDPYAHRRGWYPEGDEVLGDGFDDMLIEDPDDTVKNVKVEVDWAGNAGLSYQDVEDICGKAGTILDSAAVHPDSLRVRSGLSVIWDIATANIGNLPERMTWEEQKQYLRSSRTYSSHIHCILGTKNDTESFPRDTADAFGGIAVNDLSFMVADTSEGGLGWSWEKSYVVCTHYSSGADNVSAQDSLNSTGCYVWVPKIKERYPDSLYQEVSAVVLAHEIGHALGMNHTHEDFGLNLMSGAALPPPSEWNYNNYNFFNLGSLDDTDRPGEAPTPNHCDGAVNTRWILGRDAVETTSPW